MIAAQGFFKPRKNSHPKRPRTGFSWRFDRRHLQPQLFDLALHNMSERKPLTFKKLTQEIF